MTTLLNFLLLRTISGINPQSCMNGKWLRTLMSSTIDDGEDDDGDEFVHTING